MMGLAGTISQIKQQQQGDVGAMKNFIASSYPNIVKALRMIDIENTKPKRRKGFSLVKRESKKYGYLFYVRFSHNGRMLPSKWNTHTNDQGEAERFAMENKKRLVERYLRSHDMRMYSLLEGFYSNKETTGGLQLCGRCLKEYQAEIANTFIPYLKQARITDFGQITATNLHNYQDSLLAGGMKPQTVNNKMKAVKRVFAYLAWKGIIQDNPAERVRGLPVHHTDRDARGCYDLDRLKGVFNKRWKDQTSYLLALLIYTTGMRNGEIRRLRMEDILQVGGCRFASVRESKTASGVRLIPLHDFVYRKLCTRHAPQGAPLFDFRRMEPFNTANAELARQLGVGPEELERENITFYSGRHYWKTLMNSEGLGEDIEEIFMGHKVSGSVARLYNHRDKQGKKRMIKKARQVFSILDRCVFNTKRRGPAPAAAGVRGSSPRHVQ